MNSTANLRGFTLLEVILSISLIGLLAGLSVPVYNSFQAKNDMDNTAGSVAQYLRRAELSAISGKSDSGWGVKIEAEQLTFFRGTDFANRDQNFDEISLFPSTVAVSGSDEFSFQKFFGLPINIGTSTLTNSSGETRSIGVHDGGMIEY